jgi:hypothetical protein
LEHKSSQFVFEYRYRDAANYKVEGRVLLLGEITASERSAVEAKMESGQFFIAEQIGIPSLANALFEFGGGPTMEDHAWHEFVGFQEQTFDFQNIENDAIIGARQLLDAFLAVEDWNPKLSPNFR